MTVDMHARIEEWCARYGPDPSVISTELNEQRTTLGLTYNRYRDPRTHDVRISDIRINRKLQGHDWMVVPVLWHEYCHAESWILEGRQDGHNSRWLARLWRKPWLAFLDTIAVQIAWIIVKRTRPTG